MERLGNVRKGKLRGQFREDLFYRLNVMQIVIPPLRERREDIPALCDYYLDYYNKSFAKNIERVEPDFMRELILYDWKGNVRELKNIFERCFLFSQGFVAGIVFSFSHEHLVTECLLVAIVGIYYF